MEKQETIGLSARVALGNNYTVVLSSMLLGNFFYR
jgi:hypothetical protein